jgi:hypothetical protein
VLTLLPGITPSISISSASNHCLFVSGYFFLKLSRAWATNETEQSVIPVHSTIMGSPGSAGYEYSIIWPNAGSLWFILLNT